MSRFRICLCLPNYQRILERLREALPEDEIVDCQRDEVTQAAAEADVLIPLVTRVPDAALASPRLKLIQQYGVGLDIVDLAAATRAGIPVANVPSVGTGNAESVAELAIALLLMLFRQLPQAQEKFRQGKLGSPMSDALWRSTVLILGYGGIGEEIARRLQGFGCRVIAVSRHGPAGARVRDPAVPLAAHVAMDALPADPLLRENVIATPHIGGVTVSSLRGIAEAVAANINRLRAGQPLANCVNPEAWAQRV